MPALSQKTSDRSLITILAGVVLVIVFGLIFFQDKLKVKEHYRRVKKVLSRPTTIEVQLLEKNNSGVSGKAIITDLNDLLYVTVTLDGIDDALAKPMNIRRGTCDNLGEIVYPLMDAVNGESLNPPFKTTLGTMATQMPLAVNVHMSVRDASISVACGDLPPFHE